MLKVGKGKSPKLTDTIIVHYRGTLLNGKDFDNSYVRNEPVNIKFDSVIKGWREALPLMKEGAKWQLFIPSDLAYGENGTRSIEPNSTLLFEVELIKVTRIMPRHHRRQNRRENHPNREKNLQNLQQNLQSPPQESSGWSLLVTSVDGSENPLLGMQRLQVAIEKTTCRVSTTTGMSCSSDNGDLPEGHVPSTIFFSCHRRFPRASPL